VLNSNEYKDAVKELFQSGTATESKWDAMADAVLECSETDNAYKVDSIDAKVLGIP